MKAARILLAAHALAIIAMRPTLPSLFTWPRELWAGVQPGTALRYLWLFSPGLEMIFYALLAIALLCALFGFAARTACFIAAILLYHFAPLDDVFINASGPYSHGLTVDILGLVILAVAPATRRWPIVLIRAAVASQYVFSTIVKIKIAGLGWFGSENIRDIAILFDRLGLAPRARVVIEHPALASAIGFGWLVITLGMAATPFSRAAARVVVPSLALAHVGAIPLFGIFYPGVPLLLLFVEWPQGSAERRPGSQPHAADARSAQR